ELLLFLVCFLDLIDAFFFFFFFFSSRRRHTRSKRDWSSDVCSSDLCAAAEGPDPRVVAVQHGDYSVASGAEAMRAILRAHPGVDALFAANDRMARGAIEVLQAEGLSVPGDVLVGGFDDSAGAATDEPSLTTVRQDFRRIAVELVDALGKQIDGGVRTRVVVPVQLVVRDSTVPR